MLRRTGTYEATAIAGETVRAFVPHALPPAGPRLTINHATVMSLRLYDRLPQHPIATVKSAMALCKTTRPTAAKAIEVLARLGILEETSGKRRDRTYCYREYLDLLRVGTDLSD